MLSKKIRLLAEGLFLILALLLGSLTIGSLLAAPTEGLNGEGIAALRGQGAIYFCVFLLAFLGIFHLLLKRVLKPLEQLPEYLQKITEAENVRTELPQFLGSDTITDQANKLAKAMSLAQQEAAQEKRKLSVIMDNMDNAVALVDEEGTLLESNKSFSSMLGTEGSKALEAQGSKALEAQGNKTLGAQDHKALGAQGNKTLGAQGKALLQEEQLFRDARFGSFLRGLLHTGQSGEYLLRRSTDGVQKVYQVFGAPLTVAFRSDPSRVLLVFHDITLLQTVYERQTAFVSNASHELATPLTTIKGFAETMAADADMDEDTRQKFLNIIVTESNRMQLLLKDLLQLAKLDSAEYRKNVVLENLPTKGMLEELQTEFAQALSTRKLTMTFAYEDQPVVRTNKEWLKQILINLLENALKYTPIGGTIHATIGTHNDMAVFTMFNSGEGLSPNDKERIFARFYRGDTSHNRKAGGSGLGLSIVKFAVEMLGGTIHVESEQGQGTSFVFTMPLV